MTYPLYRAGSVFSVRKVPEERNIQENRYTKKQKDPKQMNE